MFYEIAKDADEACGTGIAHKVRKIVITEMKLKLQAACLDLSTPVITELNSIWTERLWSLDKSIAGSLFLHRLLEEFDVSREAAERWPEYADVDDLHERLHDFDTLARVDLDSTKVQALVDLEKMGKLQKRLADVGAQVDVLIEVEEAFAALPSKENLQERLVRFRLTKSNMFAEIVSDAEKECENFATMVRGRIFQKMIKQLKDRYEVRCCGVKVPSEWARLCA
eukprot:TRINITY_DN25897_c1_g2_i2.p2 TRINITY_DN25897_c1_g2~~TRINITY_DN25897_c1_g2_i2.p2  ORF type:complete len:225 (+),score=28.07 TRINITY_DN25897_c1_g2_i2:1578-2252(+)